ncbi:hypothetical protein Y032_0044g911 [Ancylostoma ceylanicum]|uniref:Uncharacterized protein n=1 Tax=Ancylostoma ceylanicum TaxID=53326 RepID=A0A016UD98_9BILA|nr:hypothetical protein Y032_0044g911 [Ancylostoma ceylanicum]
MQRVHFCGNGATVSEGREKPGEGSNVEIRIENETALVEPSTEKGDANIDKSGTSFLMDGRESIHTPCSVAHNAYVERVEQAGCQGAIDQAVFLAQTWVTACSPKHTQKCSRTPVRLP